MEKFSHGGQPFKLRSKGLRLPEVLRIDPSFRLSIEKKGDMFGIRRCAFTLAEVLVTLGIIGVVAAMTMPVLIQNHQEKVTVTRLKSLFRIITSLYVFFCRKYRYYRMGIGRNIFFGRG
ncbi:MAG: type II secretion system protein [Candidatus Gastranaerophilaceae bacterium]